jgi:serine/threonine protein kinase
MLTRISTATTRTVRVGQIPPDGIQLFAAGQVITSPETQLQYQVRRLLGAGGFGQVYLARRLGRSKSVPVSVCIKVSVRIDAWLREAYFGQLLDRHPRAIRVFDTFPVTRLDGKILYCLALEYARYGDLAAGRIRCRPLDGKLG